MYITYFSLMPKILYLLHMKKNVPQCIVVVFFTFFFRYTYVGNGISLWWLRVRGKDGSFYTTSVDSFVEGYSSDSTKFLTSYLGIGNEKVCLYSWIQPQWIAILGNNMEGLRVKRDTLLSSACKRMAGNGTDPVARLPFYPSALTRSLRSVNG